MVAIHRADVTAVSKLLAKTSGSKSSRFFMGLLLITILSAVLYAHCMVKL